MINEVHLAKLSAPIKRIVDEELATGNVVKETYIGRSDGLIFVFLKFRFTAKYEYDAEYLIIDDRHYWYAEYSDSLCTVACGFDELKAGS